MCEPLLTSHKAISESSKAILAKELELMKELHKEASEQKSLFQNLLLAKLDSLLRKTKSELMLLYSNFEKVPRVIATMKGKDVIISNRDQEVYNKSSEIPEKDKSNILKYCTVTHERQTGSLIAELGNKINHNPYLLESCFIFMYANHKV
jgi:deoxyribodipyrimidine photolyase